LLQLLTGAARRVVRRGRNDLTSRGEATMGFLDWLSGESEHERGYREGAEAERESPLLTEFMEGLADCMLLNALNPKYSEGFQQGREAARKEKN
jgi:hypothetical protein